MSGIAHLVPYVASVLFESKAGDQSNSVGQTKKNDGLYFFFYHRALMKTCSYGVIYYHCKLFCTKYECIFAIAINFQKSDLLPKSKIRTLSPH